MPNFHEFTALYKEEKSKEEIQIEKAINGEDVDIYQPGFDKYRITINMDQVVSFNEGDSAIKNDCVVVGLSTGDRYKIDMKYDDFKSLIAYHLKTKIKP